MNYLSGLTNKELVDACYLCLNDLAVLDHSFIDKRICADDRKNCAYCYERNGYHLEEHKAYLSRIKIRIEHMEHYRTEHDEHQRRTKCCQRRV